MQEIDTTIGEHDERWDLPEEQLPTASVLVDVEVKLRVPSQFGKKPRYREQHHPGDSGDQLVDLKVHLVLQVTWMVEDGLVKDKEIRQRCHG